MYRLIIALICTSLVSTPVFSAKIPRPAPDFKVPLSNGQQLELDHYKGKVVALEFLMTTCSHCKKACMIMQKLYNELGPKGFQPIGVAIGVQTPDQVQSYILQHKLNFPIGFTNDRTLVMGFLQYSIMDLLLVPQLLFIDKTGTIRAQYGGSEGAEFFNDEEKNMRAIIEELLAE